MFQHRLRTAAKKHLPKSFLIKAWGTYCRIKAEKTKKIFEQASPTPLWLDFKALEQLQSKYPAFLQTYPLDRISLEKRGRGRADDILGLIPSGRQRMKRFLDLGARDNTTSCMIQRAGKAAVGIDIAAQNPDVPRLAAAAPFIRMDAGRLGFADNSFDLVFSYNAFEHFAEPESVLRQALRVVAPGGYIYLNFGPLYYSPKGGHQFENIHVPYCQFLFPEHVLADFGKEKGLEITDFNFMNKWPLTRYHRLWRQFTPQMETLFYHEVCNADHLDLIRRYPSCFRSKTDSFSDLIVAYIEVLFRKL